LPYWEKLGLPVRANAPAAPIPRSFTPHFRPELVADAQTVLQARDATIIDARAAARYAGSVAEPRPGLRSGHVPGSINIPFASLIDADGRMKAPDLLAESLKAVGPGKRAISYCGSGVTACVPVLALYMAGMRTVAVYDGSWAEWGQDSSALPIE
jgi:thiosulfate/3-mercaptopyruvate sulfurtransferase